MKTVRVYRNPHCARCARFARAAHFFDWFNRVETSTETPRTGPLRLGEVVVEDLATGRLLRGAEGIDLIWRQIPAFTPFRPLLMVPAFRRYIDAEVGGCRDDSCETPMRPA